MFESLSESCLKEGRRPTVVVEAGGRVGSARRWWRCRRLTGRRINGGGGSGAPNRVRVSMFGVTSVGELRRASSGYRGGQGEGVAPWWVGRGRGGASVPSGRQAG
jgi:hypothetical protein